MGDHVVFRFIKPQSSESVQGTDSPGSSLGNAFSPKMAKPSTCVINVEGVEAHDGPDEKEEPLIQTLECRICQEEDTLKNLEVPCACNGSLKFAHRKCVQRWCNEKGDITCEICNQLYQPDYTAPAPPLSSGDTAIDISEGWEISGNPLDLHDPRLLTVAAAERHFLDHEYDEYADSNAGGAAFCRAAAVVLMTLLFLRHALVLPDSDEEDDASTFFSLFLLQAAGFLLPCYLMAWAISILQRRWRRQEAVATEVAFMLQAGQQRGLRFTISRSPATTAHQEPLQ